MTQADPALPHDAAKARPGRAADRPWPFWVVVAAPAVLAVILGFFPRGGRLGLYSDDYAHKAWAFDLATGGWRLTLRPMRPDFRPLHTTLTPNLTAAIPEHELPVRVGVVLLHVANVILLGRLAQRLTGSPLAALLAGGCFLVPVLANEALLWFAAAAPILTSHLFLLAGFHCLLSRRARGRPLLVGIGGVAAWVLSAQFYEMGIFTLLLLPGFLALAWPGQGRARRKVWLPVLAATYLVVGGYLFFVVRGSWSLGVRGGLTFDPLAVVADRVPAVARRLVWLIGGWGLAGPLREALALGWWEWMAAPTGWILAAGALAGTSLVAANCPREPEALPGRDKALGLGLAGLAWAGLALVPVVLVRGQIVEVRSLYTPLAGLALSVAGCGAWIVGFVGRWRRRAIQAAVLATGGAVLVSSVAMAGVARTYQLRWALDQRQIAAFREAFPRLPEAGRVWLWPVGLDERPVSAYWGRAAKLDRYLVGVFETDWGTSSAVRMTYRKDDVSAVAANRWERWRVNVADRSRDGQVRTLTIQGKAIPVAELLAFTYRQGRVIGLGPLELSSPDGTTAARLDLPVVGRLRSPETPVEPVRLRLE
jgi:hypothetical protein